VANIIVGNPRLIQPSAGQCAVQVPAFCVDLPKQREAFVHQSRPTLISRFDSCGLNICRVVVLGLCLNKLSPMGSDLVNRFITANHALNTAGILLRIKID
jgi:hypothetical protein